MVGIYSIQNKTTGKVYVGQSVEIEKRWKRHIWALNNNRHDNSHLQRAWNKYGQDDFIFKVVEQCEENFLDEKETYWHNRFSPNTYNLLGTGNRHTLPQESRNKISAKLKGRKMSETTLKKMKEAQSKINHHRKHTAEAIEKIRQAGIGRVVSQETRKKLSIASKGKPLYKLRGRKRPSEVVEKYIAPKRKIVYQYDMKWNLIKKWVSTQEASRQLKIPNSNLVNVCNRKRNQAGGYRWSYELRG